MKIWYGSQDPHVLNETRSMSETVKTYRSSWRIQVRVVCACRLFFAELYYSHQENLPNHSTQWQTFYFHRKRIKHTNAEQRSSLLHITWNKFSKSRFAASWGDVQSHPSGPLKKCYFQHFEDTNSFAKQEGSFPHFGYQFCHELLYNPSFLAATG